jgi:uncharacterized protein (UPF0212 family)
MCRDCIGGEGCPVCHGKGEALAVFTVSELVDLAVQGTLAEAERRRKHIKIARVH